MSSPVGWGQVFGRIDVLVSSAGCNVRRRAFEVTLEDWDLVLDTNLWSAFFVAQVVASPHDPCPVRPHFQYRVGDARGRLRRASPHGASRCRAMQLTVIAPEWFKTAQRRALRRPRVGELPHGADPMGRPGTPTDLDGTVVFLASAASQYVKGQTLFVDGGISVGALRALSRK